MISAHAATQGYDFKKFVAQPDEMAEAVKSVGAKAEVPLSGDANVTPQNQLEAARLLLVEMAGENPLKERTESWLKSDRKTLLEPITTALILAGPVTILSTRIDFHFKQENGKRTVEVKITKPPTTKAIMQKIASLF